jgi:hypothetical protein
VTLKRRAFLGAVGFLIASGCAQRADWIEGTLVTVNVTGRWVGTMSGGSGGYFDMTLRQTGPKVPGNITLTSLYGHLWSGPIDGTVSGDVLRVGRPDGNLRAEVIVAGTRCPEPPTWRASPISSVGKGRLGFSDSPVGNPRAVDRRPSN